jgi:hypothetical protein
LGYLVADSRDGASTSPKVKVGRLDSLPRIRRELARLYREARQGQLDPQAACQLGRLLTVLGRMLGDADLLALEQRIAALERLKR